MFFRRALTYCENMTTSPFLTRIGEVPSGPPPLGSTVVFRAVLLFRGTGGYNRRPITLSQHVVRNALVEDHSDFL